MTLLNISGLSHHYAHGGFNGKHQHQAVLNNVSLTLKSGETVALLGRSGCGKLTLQRGRVLALVGGSGSGKSLTCAATLGILPAGVRQTAGEILADGKPVSPCALRGIKIATIMQNPRSAFNPLHTMHTHARETCLALGKPADDATLTAAIEAVGLENAARVLKLYPFEMSGGMLQRMMIAMAVLCESPFIIADEPTTDLDVVAQARILDVAAHDDCDGGAV